MGTHGRCLLLLGVVLICVGAQVADMMSDEPIVLDNSILENDGMGGMPTLEALGAQVCNLAVSFYLHFSGWLYLSFCFHSL